MKVFSFYKKSSELFPLEVELTLIPGLPHFHITGLPDTAIKESVLRIKAALRAQGFALPKRKQILVNLRPSFEKKASDGLDLAIAAAYLWETEQVEKPRVNAGRLYLYGELDLEGKVRAPEYLKYGLELEDPDQLLTGTMNSDFHFNYYGIRDLQNLKCPSFISNPSPGAIPSRPPVEVLYLTHKSARLMEVVASGQHTTLLAGPSGSGKTTWAKALYQALPEVEIEEWKSIRRNGRLFGQTPSWRPIINPHHTSTTLSMVGGGLPPRAGDITRAHGGLLVLDEFLEFKNEVKEALREPMESGHITVSRMGHTKKFLANFHLVATTNLCPCGDYVPERPINCRFSLRKCRSYLEKLSGPILDRFEILSYTHEWGRGEDVSVEELIERIHRSVEFRKRVRSQPIPNSKLRGSDILSEIDSFTKKNLMPEAPGSRRREQSMLRVARTLADMDESRGIKVKHIEEARQLAISPFLALLSDDA